VRGKDTYDWETRSCCHRFKRRIFYQYYGYMNIEKLSMVSFLIMEAIYNVVEMSSDRSLSGLLWFAIWFYRQLKATGFFWCIYTLERAAGQSKIDSPETLATLSTQDTDQEPWDNQTLTVQRRWQHWAHKTQIENKQSIKTQHNTENYKDEYHGPTKHQGEPSCSRKISSSCFVIRHPTLRVTHIYSVVR